MFGRIVPRYDVMNRLMTGGQDLFWRRVAARSVQPVGALALDLATGTGDLAIELARQGARRVVAADFCAPMLDAARPKVIRARVRNVDLLLADAAELPFPDASFDCITNGFLLRNVVDLPHCLAEMRRVLRPGGRVAALELTQLSGGPLAAVVCAYSRFVIPRVGGLVSGDPAAYQYLPASVDTFPDAERLAELFRKAGFSRVVYRRFGLGRVAIHLATAGS
jgi:demethylmenaquinone methyltransferase/2-methoxy-6-polyprenyl-1,4-benzoquinol methylase